MSPPTGQPEISCRFTLSEDNEEARAARDKIIEALEACAYEPGTTFAVRLALEEALTNAFKHGNGGDRRKTVELVCVADTERVVIEVADQGPGFDPNTVPDPTRDENIEIPCGRGIVLMRSFMTDVSFVPPGNRVRMVYERTAAGDA